MNEQIQQELIDYMFLKDSSRKLDPISCLELWFGKSHGTDNEIRSRYGNLVEEAISGRLDSWMETSKGCLALMILVDQFPRNIYRHTVRMYDGDKKGMEIVAQNRDWKAELTPEQCLFMPCLILTHQEDLEAQKSCVAYYEEIEVNLQPEFRVFRTIFEEHLKIINICGTFPHRDHFYNRETSEVGKILLEDPSLRFDLPLVSENGSVRFGTDPNRLWKATAQAFDILDRLDILSTQRQQQRENKELTTDWLSDEQLAFCKDTFRKFDKDGNGNLSQTELYSVLKAVGRPYTKERIQDAMNKISGKDNSESISFEEFTTLLQSDLIDNEEQRLLERFQIFDADGSGSISMDELQICLRDIDSLLTSAEITEMLKRVDINGDGQIDYQEFYQLFQEVKN